MELSDSNTTDNNDNELVVLVNKDTSTAIGVAANPLINKLSDGTDIALITAAGEQNVLATAQPGVDIGDVTINNASGASAVNIQDGGNSITVDGSISVSNFPATQNVAVTSSVEVEVKNDTGNPVPVNGTVSANQSGTWNINNISGTVSLPTGASTLAEQQTQTTSLQLIDDIPHSQNGNLGKGVPIMGECDDVSTTAATENKVYTTRITPQRALHTNLRDNSGNEIASQNNGNANQQLLGIVSPDTTTATTALGALNAAVSIAVAGLNGVGFQLSAGTLIGTLTPELSVDGGTTWIATSFFENSTGDIYSTLVFSSSNTLKILSVLLLDGTSNVRVRVSAYTSGTANSILRASTATGATLSVSVKTSAFNTITNTNTTITAVASQILASNVNRKYAIISNTTGSQINIQLGSSTGLSVTTGIAVSSRSFFELKGDSLYTGAVFGIAAGATIITVSEGTP